MNTSINNNSGVVDKDLIEFAWSIRFDHLFEIKAKPKRIPRFKQALTFLRPGYRLDFSLLKKLSTLFGCNFFA